MRWKIEWEECKYIEGNAVEHPIKREKIIEAKDIDEAFGIGYELADKGYYKIYMEVKHPKYDHKVWKRVCITNGDK